MFEKEAEERFVKSYPEFCYNGKPLSPYWDLWQDGAEFGYNKGKEDAKEELEQIRNERNRNNWHYPSKGELPKCDEETQLIFYVNCYYNLGDEIVTKKRMVLGYYKKAFLRYDVKLFVEKSRGYEDEHLPQAVIAWKEIVLPELEESETNG